jgi:hypothetical protein
LVDLVDEFSDGRIQFAYVKVKDSNTGLPKNALIAWCGEGVPERTKGYFTSHLTAVARLLHVKHTVHSRQTLTDYRQGLPCTNYCEIRPRPHTGRDHTESCRCVRLKVLRRRSPSGRCSYEASRGIETCFHADTEKWSWWLQSYPSKSCSIRALDYRCRWLGSRRTTNHKNTVRESPTCISTNTS